MVEECNDKRVDVTYTRGGWGNLIRKMRGANLWTGSHYFGLTLNESIPTWSILVFSNPIQLQIFLHSLYRLGNLFWNPKRMTKLWLFKWVNLYDYCRFNFNRIPDILSILHIKCHFSSTTSVWWMFISSLMIIGAGSQHLMVFKD